MGVERSLTAFLAEDNKTLLASLVRLVRRRGFSPISFNSPDEARHSIATMCHAPSVAFIDVWFCGGSAGLDIAQAIRDKFSNHVPMALLTGYGNTALLAECAGRLEASVMRKPISRTGIEKYLANSVIRAVRLPLPVAVAVEELVEKWSLTVQEARVLAYLASGATRSKLSAVTGIHENTVKWHMKGLLKKSYACTADEVVGEVLRTIPDRPR